MSFLEILLIGVGLSMDALAASVCKGVSLKNKVVPNAIVIGLFFGGFQALMPLIGWFLGRQAERFISSFDHWIAFGLLTVIGGKMIIDCLKGEQGCDSCEQLDVKELLMLAIATSIDALAVGITFGMMHVNIGGAVTIIGLTTFVLSLGGVAVGHFFGRRFQKQATLIGGIILILIGIKILLEHLGLLASIL